MRFTLRYMLLGLAIVLLPEGFAMGQATFTEFVGTEKLAIPFPVDWGTLNCAGGEQLGPWPSFPPCTPGSRVHVRGMKWLYNVETNDPRFTGQELVISNGNWDGWTEFGPGPGPIWGTLRFEVKDGENKTGEVWEGSWTGIRTLTETGAYSSIHAEAHGSGGRLEGLTVKWDLAYDPVTGIGTCRGRILEPPRK